MSHHSIAIIRKKEVANPEENPQFSYLVLTNSNSQHYFFETVDNAIGATFDFTSLKRAVYKYFELGDPIENEGFNTEFETPPQPGKQNRTAPFATSYIYELSERQLELVKEHLSSGDAKWNQIKWSTETALGSLRSRWTDHQRFLFETEEPFKQPDFTNEFRADLAKIVEAKNNGKLVIFAGAGVSYDSNVPGWNQLIEELKADLTTTETSFLKIAQLYYNTRGHKEYYDKLIEVLKFGKTRYNAVHKKIIDLSPVHIVTTNYDNHFEQVIEEKVLNYSTIRADTDLPFAKGGSLYVKMHGDLGIKRVVLKESDYDSYSAEFALIESFIKETFASKLVLFLGFSFDDTNLQSILETVKGILKSDIQKPYLFAGTISNEKKKKWETVEKMGIRIVSYNTALSEYFNQISLEEDSESLQKVKKQSQEVYKFLRVVEDFDPSSDGIDNLSIQKQFSHSILRFEALGAIPIHILTRLTPFKLKKRPIYDMSGLAEYNSYRPFTLQTANEELLDFLKKSKGTKNRIEFNITSDPNLSIEDQNFHNALKILNNSGIEYIIRKNDTSTEYFQLKGIGADPKCKCLRCLSRRLEFRELIETLNNNESRALCEGNQMDEKLLEAYAYYKTGQPVKCYYALEAASNKSLKEFNYIGYFIASNNKIKILNLIRFRHESDIKPAQVDRIVQNISRIDIYDLLNKLQVEGTVRQCLLYILEDRIYHDSLPELQEEFNQIKENYKKHKKLGYHVQGPVVWFNFQARFYLIWNFYNQNLPFNDDRYQFDLLAQMYVESIIASYQTSNRYAQRIKAIWPFVNQMAIHYAYPDWLRATLKKYDVDTLDQNESNRTLLNEFHSFLESGYDRNTFLGESIQRNNLFNSLMNTSYYFDAKVTQLFNNQVILLEHVKLNHEEINLTIDKIINFLSVSEAFKASNSFSYFLGFMSKHIKEVDEVVIIKLIEFALSDQIWPASMIQSVSTYLIGINKKNFLGPDIQQKALKRIGKRREWPFSIREAIPLFQLFKVEQQYEFLKFVKEQFQSGELPTDILKYGYEWGMWNPANDPALFKTFFASVISQAQSFPIYSITKKGHPVGKDFQSWNDFYFALKLLYKYNLLESNTALELYEKTTIPMFKWVLKPYSFDYDKFNSRWALTFAHKDILKVTKSIPELRSTLLKQIEKKFNADIARIYLGN